MTTRRERRAERKARGTEQARPHQGLDEAIRAIGEWARNSGDHRVMRSELTYALTGASEASNIPREALAEFLADVHRRLLEEWP